MFPKSFETPKKSALAAAVLLITTSQIVNFPAGVTRAKVTLQDGGYSGGTATGSFGSGGQGGNAAIFWITIDPSAPYTVIVGAGGIGSSAATNTGPNAGGLTTVTPRGQATLSSASASADLRIPGATPLIVGVAGGAGIPAGGASLMALPVAFNAGGGNYGGGGAGTNANLAGTNGASGAVLIEYIAPGA